MTSPGPQHLPAPVLCFGEVLWDSVPRGLLPGGAPMNLAYHLTRLGAPAMLLSAVGDDQLGDEILQRISAWGVNTALTSRSSVYPTGVVRVTLERGIPHYEIVENVAWDHISLGTLPDDPVKALVYGSLAQRSADNREVLDALLRALPDAFRVFDVNLRPPYVDRQRISELAGSASLIKVNDEELALLLGRPLATTPQTLENDARALAADTGSPMVCVTAGSRGAGLLDGQRWSWAHATPVTVRDTIGAGDSFLAAVIFGLLYCKQPHERTLAMANRLAGLVASSDGATPPYRIEYIGDDAVPVATV